MLNKYLGRFGEPKTDVNRIRSEVQRLCREKANGQPGFYSLTVPTGGGKTLSSLVWAMNHAICYGKKRIIIAIPYSNVSVDEEKDDDNSRQLLLATENWGYPIIVTTNVQLFESMMSSHSSDCRKLHNISNSVLILDEVQTLPTDFLQPIVDTLDT